MDKVVLRENFIELIQDIYDAELQIIDLLPQMIEAASYQELKKAFARHLKETKGQVVRLERVFELLGEEPKKKTCYAMKGLIKEGHEIMQKSELTPALKDSFLIIATQKIEHYEIATYSALCVFLTHLSQALEDPNLNKIFNLLRENLTEEKKTDLLLTDIAEGTRSKDGINDAVELEIASCCE